MTRAERRTRTETVKVRRLNTLKAVDPLAPPCTPKVAGQMRSKSALGCGRPRCGVCHPSKKWKAKSERVKRRVRGEA